MKKIIALITMIQLGLAAWETWQHIQANEAAQDRQRLWNYSAEVHRNTNAPPTTLWKGK